MQEPGGKVGGWAWVGRAGGGCEGGGRGNVGEGEAGELEVVKVQAEGGGVKGQASEGGRQGKGKGEKWDNGESGERLKAEALERGGGGRPCHPRKPAQA